MSAFQDGRRIEASARRRQAEIIAAGFAGLGNLTNRAWRGLIEGWSRARRRSRTIAALQGLDDRVLQDIGVPRYAIEETVDALIEGRDAVWARERQAEVLRPAGFRQKTDQVAERTHKAA